MSKRDLQFFNSKIALFRSFIFMTAVLLSFLNVSQAETTTLEAIKVGEQKMEDPYIEGFKAYAKELAGEGGLMQHSVQSFTEDLIRNKSAQSNAIPKSSSQTEASLNK